MAVMKSIQLSILPQMIGRYGESNVKNQAILTKNGENKGTADGEVWIGEKSSYVKQE